MTHFFERRDPWGNGMALWVLMGLLFLIPPAVWSVQQIDLENDVENWLPATDPQTRTLAWYRNHFESDDRLLISWDSSSLDDPRLAKFAAKLIGVPDENGLHRNGLPQVSAVVTPIEIIERMTAQGVDRNTAIESLQGLLVGHGPLKVTLTDAGRQRQQTTIDTLIAAARETSQLELTAAAPAKTTVAQASPENAETTNASGTTSNATETASDTKSRTVDFELRWSGMQFDSEQVDQVRAVALALRGQVTADSPEGEPLVAECFFTPGSPAAIAVTLSESGEADTAGVIEAIRMTAAEVGIRPEELRMAGHAVTGAALNQEVRTAAWNRSFPLAQPHRRSVILLSVLVSIVIAGIVLRKLLLALFVLGVSAFTLLTTVALVPATSGSMNMVLIVLPTLLWVVTISAAMHVANYWKHAARKNLRDAVVRATIMARRPCLCASFTATIGLFALTSSPLAPVKDFGFYGAIGCLISLVLVLYGLPALLQFWPSSLPEMIEADGTEWKWLGEWLLKRRAIVLTSCLLAFAGGMYGLRWFRTETRVIQYFPEEARVAQDYRFLEEQLAGIMPLEMVVRFDAEAQSRLNFLERVGLVRTIEGRMRRLPHVSGALSLADFQLPVEQLGDSPTFMQKAKFNKQAALVESAVKESSDASLKSLFVVAAHDTEIPGDASNQLSKAGDELWRITAHVATLSNVNYNDLTRDLDGIAQEALKRHAGAGHVVTGMVPVFMRTQQAVLQSLIKSFVISLVVIGIMMSFVLRNPVSGLLALLPNAIPIGMVFGIISWCGWSVDLGTMVTASVALGIAVDNTLHLLTWFRSGLEEGLPRHEACMQALERCAPAMWQTTLVISLGLLMLVPADLLLISRFGLLMAALTGTALAANVVLMPVLLDGVLGRMIQNSLIPIRASAAVAQRLARPAETAASSVAGTAPLLQPHLKVIAPTSTKQGRKLRVD